MASSFFDVIGPVMIGPSSSHTAGAARIGLAVNRIMDNDIKKARITLYNSFAETGKGHGTDMALIGGLIGFGADDPRLRDSFNEAKKLGLEYEFLESFSTSYHPNTVRIEAEGTKKNVFVRASSVGGGSIRIDNINGYDVNTKCEFDTIIFVHTDRPGILADITREMGEMSINIASMHVSRERRGGKAVSVLEVDDGISEETIGKIKALDIINEFLFVPKIS